MLRSTRMFASRRSFDLASPNIRSKITRGLTSVGSGVVGDDHEMVLR